MPMVTSERGSFNGEEGTRYTVEVTSKMKPDLGLVENESLAERKARNSLILSRPSLSRREVEFVDITKLRESPFSMRADYRVTFFVSNGIKV